MEILRPMGAEDNEVNKECVRILEHWAERNGEVIKTLAVYGLSATATTESGRYVRVRETAGCMSRYKNVREHLVMYEEVEEKSVRIKKAEW